MLEIVGEGGVIGITGIFRDLLPQRHHFHIDLGDLQTGGLKIGVGAVAGLGAEGIVLAQQGGFLLEQGDERVIP